MSSKRVKQYLMLLTAIGLIAIASGGSGTFASFTAEVENPGNTFATGTLYLHDSVSNNTECTSESAANNTNVSPTVGGTNPGDHCDFLFTVPSSQFAPNGIVGGVGLTAGAISSITVNDWNNATTGGLLFSIPSGDEVQITQGSNTDICTAAATAAAGATSINVTGCTITNSYTANGTATISSPGPYIAHLTLRNAGTIDGKDLKFQLNQYGCQYSGQTLGANLTTTPGWNTTEGTSSTGNTVAAGTYTQSSPVTIPLGGTALVDNLTAGTTLQISDATPQSDTVTLAANASSGATSITVYGTLANSYDNAVQPYTVKAITVSSISTNALAFGIPINDTIQVSDGSHQDTFTVSANAAAGATSVSVNPQIVSYPYSSGDTVGKAGTCANLPFTITETNENFAAAIASGTGNITSALGCAWPAGNAGVGGCNPDTSFPLSSVALRNNNAYEDLTLQSGQGTNNSRDLLGVDSITGHATGSGPATYGLAPGSGAYTASLTNPGGARYFLVEIWPGNLANDDMGVKTTFDLVWHMDQA